MIIQFFYNFNKRIISVYIIFIFFIFIEIISAFINENEMMNIPGVIPNYNTTYSKISSLVFVFDVTGSMLSELDQVKNGAAKILKTVSENEKTMFNYILIPFSDPQIGPATVTSNTTEFKTLLKDLIVEGGGDCPEMTLTGIKKSLELSSLNSHIFVFTDAHSKDSYLLPDVLDLIQKKHSQITFILTGNCDDDGSDIEEFQEIAAISSGQILNLLKNDVHLILEHIRLSLHSMKVNLLSIDYSNTTNDTKTFILPIDETVKEFAISLAGKNATINVNEISGNQPTNESSIVYPLLNLESIKIFRIQKSKASTWKINVTSIFSYSLRITGQSNINFIYGFSIDWTTSINKTSEQPFKSVKNFILIESTDPNYVVNLISCEILTFHGTILDAVPLNKVNETDLYFGLFIPNNTDFYLQINGVTKHGSIIRRISSTAIISRSSSYHPIVTLPEKHILRMNEPSSIKCKIESPVFFTVHWLKNSIFLNYTEFFKNSAEASLEFPKPSPADIGNFTCIVIYGNENITKFTNVHVIEAPIIEQNFSNKIILKQYDDFDLRCSANGFPKPKLRWFVNHTNEINETIYNDNLILLSDHTLLFMNSRVNQSGFYTCVATNDGGTDRRDYDITVLDENELPSNVTSVKVLEYDKVSLYCPNIDKYSHVQWLKNNSPLNMENNQRADEPHYIIANNGKKLKILEALTADTGFYTCLVQKLNESTQCKFFLKVFVPLFFNNSLETMHIFIREHDKADMDCSVDGYPSPELWWKKNGFMWPVNNWTLENVVLQYPHKQHLTINPVIKNIHSGKYECIAKNEMSSIRRNFILDII